jgi:hypothetical protein
MQIKMQRKIFKKTKKKKEAFGNIAGCGIKINKIAKIIIIIRLVVLFFT